MGPQEDYIETVFTCEGDYHDPHLQDRLEDFQRSLKDLLRTDKNKLILKKVEPWNSVRVTFKIPREAAVRLKRLAQQGNATLKELGVLAVQIQDQNISLTIAGKNNEHTQLVFRTAESSQVTTPSVSVIQTNSTALDGLSPQGPGPGPSPNEVTSKKIADYLRQLLPGHLQSEAQKVKNNSFLPFHGLELQGKPASQSSTPASHFVPRSSRSPSNNGSSPSQSPTPALKFPQIPGLPPGFPHGLVQQALDNLPPPPPYPGEGLNNLQKLRLAGNLTNPLLVNLLHHDPTLSSLLQAGKLPAGLDPESLQPPKKKRKPRRPKEKKEKKPEQNDSKLPSEIPTSFHPTIPSSTMAVHNMASSRLLGPGELNSELYQSVSQVSVHNMPHENKVESVTLTSPLTPYVKRMEEVDTVGKIINPVTGLLEPVDLSDTSPAKSDGDKHSPRSLQVQKLSLPGEMKGEEQVMASVGAHVSNSNQRQCSASQNMYGVNASEVSQTVFSSSHLGRTDTTGLTNQVHVQEALTVNSKLVKAHGKNDVLHSDFKLQQSIPRTPKAPSESVKETRCDSVSSVNIRPDTHRHVHKAQEVDTQAIPSQLLNKPLLAVKHNSSVRTGTGKPSFSPDSNGDSEASTHSINLDTHNLSDPGSHSGHQNNNNTDSGVGSCSERSEDTSTELGETDFKPGHSNSIDSAKPMNHETVNMKHPPPSSKVMTVGYALEETQGKKKTVNHKIVSAMHNSDKGPNMVHDMSKVKGDRNDVCSASQSKYLTSQEQQQQIANNVKAILMRATQENLNRKSPKLAIGGHNSVGHSNIEGNHNSMQESSMPKKKSSPRNSPRHTGSPRNPSSPRGRTSPRAVDPNAGIHPPWPYLGNQDIMSAHFPACESQKSPIRDGGRSPLTEQRKSPFNMLPVANSVSSVHIGGHMNSVEGPVIGAMDTMRVPPQCNIDNRALFKSLEAYHQFAQLATAKDPNFLQKYEELKFLQKIHNQKAGVNGMDPLHNLLRPGLSGVPAMQQPPVCSVCTDVHVSNNNMPVFTSSVHGPNVSNVLTTPVSIGVVAPKSSKLISDEQKASQIPVSSKRLSAATTSGSIPIHSYDSALPLPKRLTESVQKLLNFPLDPSLNLPQTFRRSPSSSCATPSRTIASQLSQSATAIAKPAHINVTSSSANFRNQVSDNSHIDIDSITPSITRFALGPMSLSLESSSRSLPLDLSFHPESAVISSIAMQDMMLGHGDLYTGSTTKVVPAMPGYITSHTVESSSKGFNAISSSHQKIDSQTSVDKTKEATLCNSETSNNLRPFSEPSNNLRPSSETSNNLRPSSETSNNLRLSSVRTPPSSINTGQPVVQPPVSVVKYLSQSSLLSHSSLPSQSCLSVNAESVFSPMGLTEMLQETASIKNSERVTAVSESMSTTVTSVTNIENLHIVTTSCNVSSSSYVSVSVGSLVNCVNDIASASVASKDTHHNTNSEGKLPEQTVDSNATVNAQKTDDSDIPKLKRQTSLNINITNASKSSALLGQDWCDSDHGKSQDSFSSNNSTPPVLTAVSDISELGTQSNAIDCEVSHLTRMDATLVEESSEPIPDLEELTLSLMSGKHKERNLRAESVPSLSRVEKECDNIERSKTDVDVTSAAVSGKLAMSLRKRRASSESIDERVDESDSLPRQLRSRKRTNPDHDSNSVNSDDAKKPKLDNATDNVINAEMKDKVNATAKNAVTSVHVHPSESESIKSGLRTRTNSKVIQTVEQTDKSKPLMPNKDGKKDTTKVTVSKPLVEKKIEVIKTDDLKKGTPVRRNRPSPSVQPADKSSQSISHEKSPLRTREKSPLRTREKSPLRTNRIRGHNSPLTIENSEDSQDIKRTTRSTRSKDSKEVPVQTSGKALVTQLLNDDVPCPRTTGS
ncbi:uncharacterized protein LOC127874327 isoform X2 [Dreissena polymorpha]|uniref:uncharacterized protein LOC127874327 isoform X2 n=1 Tax=Dreissena polymorpha TaxID=45954 RepID=UPI002263E2F2|nr:uncharacterized protein LOC127874327 isoform X2 [Dreissena polymorpha]